MSLGDEMRQETERLVAEARPTPEIRSEEEAAAIARDRAYLSQTNQDGSVTVWPDGQKNFCAATAATFELAQSAAQRRFAHYLRYYPADFGQSIREIDVAAETILAYRDQLNVEPASDE